jgi:hypothetical protein
LLAFRAAKLSADYAALTGRFAAMTIAASAEGRLELGAAMAASNARHSEF